MAKEVGKAVAAALVSVNLVAAAEWEGVETEMAEQSVTAVAPVQAPAQSLLLEGSSPRR